MTRVEERIEILKTLEVGTYNPYPLHLENEYHEANHRIAAQVQDLFLLELENVQMNLSYIIQNPIRS